MWIAGASRYITHLSILAIAVGAVLLATAKLPSASGATPNASNAANASNTVRTLSVSRVDPNVSQGSGGADEGNASTNPDDSILRSFAPISSSVTTDNSASNPAAPRELFTYTVRSGDTLFGIANAFDRTPETILWSNYKELKDNPDLLSIGMNLRIPPSNGLIVVIEEGDTIVGLARLFRVEPQSIVDEPMNGLTNINQPLTVGRELFVPGGQRETVVWQLPKPVEVRKSATGVRVYRVGTCGEVAIPALGTGGFIYPSNAHRLSGYNFSGWHPGLDFAGHLGDPIYAADSGTVIYAGYSLNAAGVPVGYGHYVVIDHGNGYQTLYAHASQLFVSCGQQVLQGTQIAAVGSVGNSTGPHLHFEIRRGGTALNPWSILPSP